MAPREDQPGYTIHELLEEVRDKQEEILLILRGDPMKPGTGVLARIYTLEQESKQRREDAAVKAQAELAAKNRLNAWLIACFGGVLGSVVLAVWNFLRTVK